MDRWAEAHLGEVLQVEWMVLGKEVSGPVFHAEDSCYLLAWKVVGCYGREIVRGEIHRRMVFELAVEDSRQEVA